MEENCLPGNEIGLDLVVRPRGKLMPLMCTPADEKPSTIKGLVPMNEVHSGGGDGGEENGSTQTLRLRAFPGFRRGCGIAVNPSPPSNSSVRGPMMRSYPKEMRGSEYKDTQRSSLAHEKASPEGPKESFEGHGGHSNGGVHGKIYYMLGGRSSFDRRFPAN